MLLSPARLRHTFRITAAQHVPPRHDPEAALHLGRGIVREAAAAGADLVAFPEMWSTGYALPIDLSVAQPVDGPFVEGFRDIAAELGVGVLVTALLADEHGSTNSTLLIGRRGELLLRHDKVHLLADAEAGLRPGDGFEIGVFDGVRVGVMTCWEREFPEAARELMLAGAEVIVVPNASAWNPTRSHQLEARAFENMVAIASINYPGDGWGRSSAYTPIVFDPQGRPLSALLAQADARPQFVPFRFDLDALRDWRAREVWGARYRRPEAYRRLRGEVDDPRVATD
ncbi:carbon-nitrogen hydrolase family protein [Propioniciclava coleopterorum]|uniref:Carbon-nitrogen hydrolase family protein n=1 Tax=Propioniciclava coleopterorum TaxID=2714937 RepID=A0A6G7Y4W4_9ACTN|nr:carbon-nitrogen hydrolase family protein [Propioniciclava coleopterorum]QIK71823.1 carbon-nitrogen hydrolase family protein [Propioniciclava coleopterorum]